MSQRTLFPTDPPGTATNRYPETQAPSCVWGWRHLRPDRAEAASGSGRPPAQAAASREHPGDLLGSLKDSTALQLLLSTPLLKNEI